MLMNETQQQLVEAIQQLDLDTVKQLLQTEEPNFVTENGPPVSILCDGLIHWWEKVCDAYEAHKPLTAEQKQQELQVYLDILEALIAAKANLHLWDSDEFYGPLWDAASAACEPVVQRLLDEKVNPNTLDDEGLTILSSISYLFFECDYDEIDWDNVYPEIQLTLTLLRDNGAKMSKELSQPVDALKS